MKAVVIIPTYNEKENVKKIIPLVMDEVFPNIKNHDMAILIADDNSPDGTGDEVKSFMKKYKNLDIVTGPKKGLGAAYVRGMDYAIEKMNADVVFEMDADGQHDATKIPEFMKKIDEGDDMVLGTRYSDGGSIPKEWPIQRKIVSVVANLFVRAVFMKFNIHDWTGGYRALKKEVFLKEREELKNFKGYIFQISFLQKAVRDGFKIGEVPFHFGSRTIGDSKIAAFSYILEVVKFVLWTRFTELLFGKFGKFLAVGGLGFVINAIVLRLGVEALHWNPSVANLAGAALAIFSNYNFNNIWTFKEQKITSLGGYIKKLITFYLTSAFGVIFIQTGTIFVGDHFFGTKGYFLYFLVGTGLLLIWNFTIYNRFIWKSGSK
ncbi:MAG TPA: glycosyltransferase [Patescibacteria group bacterium]|nr:glycosyltransferase [Patescibacteria group bacterium]